jgi:hypothetical protein
VTPLAINHQGSVKHVPANTKKLKAIRISTGRIKKIKFYHRGPDDSIQEFWRVYETGLGIATKREFDHNIFIHHNANLQKIARSVRNCFEGRNAANRYRFIPRLSHLWGFPGNAKCLALLEI